MSDHHINGISWKKAGQGEYSIPLTMPPVRPEIMNNIVASLTDDEIAALPEIKRAYDDQMERWRNTTLDTSAMAAELRAVGIETEITNMEWAQWLETVFNGGDFDLTIISHVEPMDLDIYARPDYYIHYAKPDYVALMDKLKAAV